MKVELTEREPAPEKWLILDVENGPSWGWGPNGYTYSQVFCIAWKWAGERRRPRSVVLDWRKGDAEIRETLAPVLRDIASAGGFIGHNFGHDTGLLVATAKDCGAPLPIFEGKEIIDTMRSVPKSSGSMRSMEALVAQFNLGEKPHVDTYTWKQAWIRWDTVALFKVIARCEADVILTEKLYDKERELGWLR